VLFTLGKLAGVRRVAYDLTDLMVLITTEGVDRLILTPGDAPMLYKNDERHCMEGPPLTALDTELIFRKLADTRQLRQLRDEIVARFIYAFRSTLFLVTARLWSTGVILDFERDIAQQIE
jgi:hypothetical protein